MAGIYGAGVGQITTPTGAEQIFADNGGAAKVWMTSAQIASLSGNGLTVDLVNTAVTAVAGTTLPAAAIVGGLITRSGPTAAYTDTIDSAANIVATIGAFVPGATIQTTFKNATAFSETLAAGAGITLPPTFIVGPYQETQYLGVIGGTAAAPTVTFTHILTTSISLSPNISTPIATPLTTVGAGTITAAGVTGGITTRGGVQVAAFVDTTDTAVNILAANPALVSKVGASTYYVYNNNTAYTATIAGGAGVTVSGTTSAPPNSWVIYLLTVTGTGVTLTLASVEQGAFQAKGTFVANGATAVTVANTALTLTSTVKFGLNTIGGTPAGAPYIATATPGTGFTVKVAAGDTSTYNYVIEG